MLAEIIAIGSELTSGAKLDTNSQWLSTQLASVGVEVHFHSTVADSIDNLVNLLRAAVDRSDLILITGGLGPTMDDLTRDAMARLADVELQIDAQSLRHLEAMFVKRGRTMPDSNRIQAMFPVGSRPIENHHGTAPGIRMEALRSNGPDGNQRSPSILAAFPGVPSEMRPMFNTNILVELAGTGKVIRHARINCFGAGESHTEELLGDLTARGNDPEVGITASDATITMRIAAAGKSIDECESKIATARAAIYERLPEFVFGEEDTTLQDVIVDQLLAAGKTVCCAEDATAGLMSQWIASVEGSSAALAGGLVGSPLSKALPNQNAATPQEVATAIRTQFAADFAIAIGPLATPADSDIPAIEYAIIGDDLLIEKTLPITGNPAIMKSRTAKAAMNELRLYLSAR